MKLLEMKKKVLQLIEEVSTDTKKLTDDPDIEAKMNSVINQVQNELARMKKIPAYKEIEVDTNVKNTYDFKDIKGTDENEIYQLDVIRGIEYELKANGTVIKCLEDGTMEIDYFKYPIAITKDTDDDEYTFELSDDALEVMPYGVAADLLKSDVSNNYGQIYAQRYETMLQRLDPRYNMGTVYIEGGIEW
ncbi:MAG: hypothetical protein J6D28_04650 [Bacilli bacterium]|nr:hypothetical protein [Bacilli bacterium]